MTKQKTIQSVLISVAVCMIVVLMSVFAGCNPNREPGALSAKKAMDETVSVWENVKTDALAAGASQTANAFSLGTDASGLTLQNGLDADNSGVGQLLCFDFLTASLYIAQTLTATGSDYTLGAVFSGTSVVSKETQDSYLSYGGLEGVNIAIRSGVVKLDDNVISGEIIINSPFGMGPTTEFNFYAQFEAIFDKTTYAITDFKIAFYDNDSQNAGENLWYFTGVTYANMQGISINVDTAETPAEIAFATKVKTNAAALYNKTATVTEKDFSTEMNKGLVFGAELTTALMS